MREPTKYEQSPKGLWVITAAWKEWVKKAKQVEADKAAREKPKSRKKEPITAENHNPIWREIARSSGSGKKIFFCTCMRENGQAGTCGAVAVQQGRTAKMEVILEPRFE